MLGLVGSEGPGDLEAIQVLGQLSNHGGLEGVGVKTDH